MKKYVRISSKRQITIPVDTYNKLNLHKGDLLMIDIDNSTIHLQKAQDVLDSLVGSVQMPNKYHDMDLDTIISQAKHEQFSSVQS